MEKKWIFSRALAVAAAVVAVVTLRPAFGEIRVIAETKATSRCIGNPVTATCAVETLLACLSRAERELCEAVGVSRLSTESLSSSRTIHYVLDDVLRLRPGDRYCWAGNLREGCVVGDSRLVVVELAWSSLADRREDRPDFWYRASYLTRQADGQWEVLEWLSEAQRDDGYRHSAEYREDYDAIGIDDASSGCIGDPETPECAVETFKACIVRAAPELCRAVGIENFEGRDIRSGVPINYRIRRVQEFVPGDLYCSEFIAVDDCRISKPDFAAVYLWFRRCRPDDTACRNDPFTIVDERCLTRRVEDRWRVVGCEEDQAATLP